MFTQREEGGLLLYALSYHMLIFIYFLPKTIQHIFYIYLHC